MSFRLPQRRSIFVRDMCFILRRRLDASIASASSGIHFSTHNNDSAKCRHRSSCATSARIQSKVEGSGNQIRVTLGRPSSNRHRTELHQPWRTTHNYCSARVMNGQ